VWQRRYGAFTGGGEAQGKGGRGECWWGGVGWSRQRRRQGRLLVAGRHVAEEDVTLTDGEARGRGGKGVTPQPPRVWRSLLLAAP
jgi:hypothetical protein